MKWTLLLDLFWISLVAGDGAWKLHQEYNYDLITKAVTAVPKLNNKFIGSVFRARLSIHPQSENLLIGKITGAEYAEAQPSKKWNSELNHSDLAYNQWPLDKPFLIHLNNSAIRGFSVDRTMNNRQINHLKIIVSQLQVDTNVQNKNEKNSDNTFYRTIEETVTGVCENLYDISPLPAYLVQANRDLVPLPGLGDGEFINIVKTRNYNNCTDRVQLVEERSIDGIDNSLFHSEVTRIIISGSMKSYTIQSSVTTTKVALFDQTTSSIISHVKLILASVKQNTRPPQVNTNNLLQIDSLIYNEHLLSESLSDTQNIAKSYSLKDGEDQWTGCYTMFVTGSSMCRGNFGDEWEPVSVQNGCGFLGLGHKALCQHNFPGCEATACYTIFMNDLCKSQFDGHLSIHKGGFEDCSPGFWRFRCCPN